MGKKQKKGPKKTMEGKTKTTLLSSPFEASHEFEGLAGFEEVSTCTLIKRSRHGEVKREMWKDGKIVKKKNKRRKQHGKACEDTESVNGKRNNTSNTEFEHKSAISEASVVCDEEPSVKSSAIKRKKQNKSRTNTKPIKKARYDSTTYHGARQGGRDKVDVSAWKEVFAPSPVLEALAELGFSQPTEIQRLVLPAAIQDRMDIIGAAETGSGKTLAFGIPIIHGILADKLHEAENPHEEAADSGVEDSEHEDDSESKEDNYQTSDSEGNEETVEEDINENVSSELDDHIDENVSDTEDINDMSEELGCVKVIDNADFSFMEEDRKEPVRDSTKKLRALVVTPTRELAIQVKSHLCAILSHTDITVAVVMGGVAAQKQERLLHRGPDIVVGTPGRLWELIQQGNEHLSQTSTVK